MAIFDALTNMFRRQRPKPTEVEGTSGTAVWNGYVDHREKSPQLSGRERYVTFKNHVVNVAIIAAAVRLSLYLMAKPRWTVNPSGPTPDHQRAAELVDLSIAVSETPWARIVRRQGTFRFNGNAVQEWIARRRKDGTVVIREVQMRPSSTIEQWAVDRERGGTLLGIVQRSPYDGAEHRIPRAKLIYSVDDSIDDSPEGIGLLRHVSETVRRLSRYEQLEGWGYETDLRGIPMGRAPIAALNELVRKKVVTEEDAQKQLKPLVDFLTNHIRSPQQSILLDSQPFTDATANRTPSAVLQWGVELLRSEGMGHEWIGRAIDRLQREVARILGAEFLMMGGDGAGSYSQHRDKTRQFEAQLNATIAELACDLRRDYAVPLLILNGYSDDDAHELAPDLVPDPIAHEDAREVADALKAMSDAGALLQPDDPVINQVRSKMGLVEVPQEILDRVALGATLRAPERPGPVGDEDGNPPIPEEGSRTEELNDTTKREPRFLK